MTKEDIQIGMDFVGFKFKGSTSPCGYAKRMDEHIGEIGKVTHIIDDVVQVVFKNKQTWNYPIKDFLKMKEEENAPPINLEELFNEIRKL